MIRESDLEAQGLRKYGGTCHYPFVDFFYQKAMELKDGLLSLQYLHYPEVRSSRTNFDEAWSIEVRIDKDADGTIRRMIIDYANKSHRNKADIYAFLESMGVTIDSDWIPND